MKNILLILFCLFAFSSVKAEIIDQKFNLKAFQTPTDFYGVIATKNNLIVHGSNGIYYFSSDKGNEWFEKKIASNSPINKLLFDSSKNEIIGFTNDGTLLISKDEGLSFSLTKLNFINRFLNFEYDGEYYFIKTDGSLICMNNEYQLVSKINSDLLISFDFPILGLRNDYLLLNKDDILFNCFNLREEFDTLRHYLYKIKKTDLIKNNSIIDTLKLCNSCELKGINNFFKIKNKFYISENSGKDILLDSNYNYLESLNSQILTFNAFTFNEELYNLMLYSGDKTSCNFYKFNSKLNVFDSIGQFDKKYYNLYRFYGLLKFSDSCFITLTNNNLIFLSRDSGKIWRNPIYKIENIKKIGYINDSTIVKINDAYKIKFSEKNYTMNKLYDHTNLNIPNIIQEYYKASYIDTNGKMIIIRTNNVGNSINDPIFNQNILLGSDFGKNFTTKKAFEIDYTNASHCYFDRTDNSFHDVFNVAFYNKNRFFISEFDTNMNLLQQRNDTNYMAYHALIKSSNDISLLASKLIDSNKSLSIIQSKDFFKTSVELNTIEVNYDYIRTYNLGKNKDSILIITYLGMDKADSSNVESNIFLYVLSENKFTKLYSSNSISRPKILLDFEEHLYIVGKNCLLENTNRSDLSAWKKYDITDNSNWDYCESYNAKSQKVQVAYFSNQNYPYTLYEISEDFVNEIKNESQTEYNNAIYTTAPYPIPAKDHIRTLVYWDNTVNFDKFEFNVYDIKGNLMKLNEKANIKQINSYSGFLEVDCSALPNGIYIVNITNDGINKSISVVIER